MLLFPSLLLALILFLRFGPDIPFKRMLNKLFVEAPLDCLAKRGRHGLLYFIMVTAILIEGGKLLLMEPEILVGMVMGSGDVIFAMGPEFGMWYAAELVLYLDALAFSYLLSTISTVGDVLPVIRARFTTWRNRVLRLFKSGPRQRTSRRHAPSARADNDDDGEGIPRLPLAA